MATTPWQKVYTDKLVSAEEAIGHLRNGQTLFVGSGAGEPFLLTETLAEMARSFSDIGVIHLNSARSLSLLTDPKLSNVFRYNTLYSGRGVSPEKASDSLADFTPMSVSELPRSIASGILTIDVALVQVSPPDEIGLCSLGVSVDATRAAVDHAGLVIAQVNEDMPVTMGDSLVPVDELDLLVEGRRPLPEVPSPDIDPVSLTIGHHVAGLVTDGMTLHFDAGPVSAATMKYLDTKKDLGIHTDILTDNIMRLIRSRSVTNRKKSISKGRTVASMVLGSEALYRAVDGNPHFEIMTIDKVSDPEVIAKNDSMVSIINVDEIELTGLARSEMETFSDIPGLPTSIEFIDGARRSRDGFTIMALPSTTADGKQSRITALSVSRGVAFTRAKVDFVVTEYGVVNLKGASIRERAIKLISIAHPAFRRDLIHAAKQFNYLDADYEIPPGLESIYPHHYEFSYTFEDELQVFFRPMRPCDARRFQRMFYSLSHEARRLRYHGTKATLTFVEAQRIAAVDYSKDMSIVGLVGPRHSPRLIAEGRYSYNPANNMGEFDIVVDGEFRGRGIAMFLANYLNKIAYARGLNGVYADVIQQNSATVALLNKAWPTARKTFDSGTCTFTVRFPIMEADRPRDSVIVYSGRFGDFSYGEDHPFDPARARGTIRLLREQGYVDEPWIRIVEPTMISKERLTESHDIDYINALEEANSGEWDERFLRFHLGGDECPVFPGLFDYVLLYTSATLTGVDLIADENANLVFNPLGGFHHASRSMAEGFCYVNDAIVAIDALLAKGYRVAYIDIDAHHGNGVQDAYYRDDRVLTVSLHQTGKTLYPWGGFETEVGEDNGEGCNINIPLPEETDDEAYLKVFDRVVVPAVDAFGPMVVVAVTGTDTHKSDPMAKLNLTNNGMVGAIERMREFSRHLFLLAGGGYNMAASIRAWCRMWAAANWIDSLPDYLLTIGGTFARGEGSGGADIVDMSYNLSGAKKIAILKELDRIAEFHEQTTMPRLRSRLNGSK